MRAQQYRQEQTRYVEAQLPPEEIDRRITERLASDHETDKRAFDAAGALALSYVAVKSLPPFDKLADLSRKHLTADETPTPSNDVASSIKEQSPGAQTEEVGADTGIDLAKSLTSAIPPTRSGGKFGQRQRSRQSRTRTSPTSWNR